jgi:hypothetical protein
MTSRDFCYWLQGFFEISSQSGNARNVGLSAAQVDMIQKHLNMVFKHEIDPSYGDAAHVAELNNIHNSTVPYEIGATLLRC